MYNNYKQALRILDETPQALGIMKFNLGITLDDVFDQWLVEEKAYLEGLKKEPQVETAQMDYYQKLIKLWESK